jgi:predicted transcriptional regulator
VTAYPLAGVAGWVRKGVIDDVCLYIMNRTQIYLDDSQTARLDQRAAAEGTSRSMLIRRAVDVYLSREERDALAWQTQWNKALEGSAGVAPYLEEGADYVEDIRGTDAERLSRLGL